MPAKFENLPLELVNEIFKNDLPLESFAALRFCLPHLDWIFLPRLFRTIHVTLAERHLERLKGVAASPYLAPHVQELVFVSSATLDTHEELYRSVHTDVGRGGYARKYNREFLACVGSLPNLHTFASELGPASHTTEKQNIDGLVYAIMPALCRASSRVTSLRCQDPSNYDRWFHLTFVGPDGPPSMFSQSLPREYPTMNGSCALDRHGNHKGPQRTLSEDYRTEMDFQTRYCFPVEWASALQGLVKLDVEIRIRRDIGYVHSSGQMLRWFLKAALNLEEFSLRRTHTGHLSPYLYGIDSSMQLSDGLQFSMYRLRTLKITDIQIACHTSTLTMFLKHHAATLRHVMLHDCSDDGGIVKLVRFAAEIPDIQLHRFAISTIPMFVNSSEWNSPLIPEKLVLDYINSKDPQHEDPFRALSDNWWRTVEHKAESKSTKWPEDGEIHFTCEECGE